MKWLSNLVTSLTNGWETAEDSYEDLDPEIRNNQVIIFYLG